MGQVNIALEIFGIVVTAVLVVCCLTEQNRADKLTKYYIIMLILNIFSLASDMFTWIFEGKEEYTILLYTSSFLSFSIGYVLLLIFTCYILSYIQKQKKIVRLYRNCVIVMSIFAIMLVVVSLGNKMYFSVVNGRYIQGPLFWVSQVFSIVVSVGDMALIFAYRKRLGWKDTLALSSYVILTVIALIIQIWVYDVTLVYLSTTISGLIIYLMIHAEQEKRLQALELEQTQQRILIMMSQIKPHFLFNALNTIQYLCETQPDVAAVAVENFSKFLRGNMDSLTQKTPIPLEQELLHVKQYLAIEQLRFDNLKVEYKLKTTDFCVPSLTIQTIVENAVCHGVTKGEEGGTITISADENDKAFYVIIADDGEGMKVNDDLLDERSHIGISNTRDRLKSMCNGEMQIISRKGEGTTVTISIPREKQ